MASLARIALASDGVFRDGVTLGLPSVTGDAATAFAVTLDVSIAI